MEKTKGDRIHFRLKKWNAIDNFAAHNISHTHIFRHFSSLLLEIRQHFSCLDKRFILNKFDCPSKGKYLRMFFYRGIFLGFFLVVILSFFFGFSVAQFMLWKFQKYETKIQSFFFIKMFTWNQWTHREIFFFSLRLKSVEQQFMLSMRVTKSNNTYWKEYDARSWLLTPHIWLCLSINGKSYVYLLASSKRAAPFKACDSCLQYKLIIYSQSIVLGAYIG